MLIIRGVRLFVRLFGRLLLCSSESEFLGCNCNKHDYLHIRGIRIAKGSFSNHKL